MMERRRTKSRVLYVAVCLLLLLTAGTLYGIRAQADEGTEAPDPLLFACKQLTDTGTIEGANITVAQFVKRLKTDHYLDPAEANKAAFSAELNTCLKRCIPAKLWEEDGIFAYVGNAYSFAIYKKTDLGGRQIAYVLLTSNEYEHEAKDGVLTTRVEVAARHLQKTDSGAWKDIGETDMFHVRDVRFGCFVSNEHEANTYDDNYDKKQDNGVIIRQSRVAYKGMMKYDVEFTAMPILKFAANYVLQEAMGTVTKLVPGIGTLQMGLNKVEDIVEFIDSCFIDRSFEIKEDLERNIFDEQSKTAQQNDGTKQGLSKGAIISPNKDEHLIITDYAQAKFLLNDTNAETHCLLTAEYDIVLYDGINEVIGVKNSENNRRGAWESVLYESVQSAQEGANAGYNRSQESEQIWQFTPDKTGEYTITASSGRVEKFNEESRGQKYTNNAVTYNLTRGTTYYIATTGTEGKYTLQIDYMPEEIEPGEHSLTLQSHEEVYYTLKTDNLTAFNMMLRNTQSGILFSVEQNGGTLAELAQDGTASFTLQGSSIVKLQSFSSMTLTFDFVIAQATDASLGERIALTGIKNAYIAFTPQWGGLFTVTTDGTQASVDIELLNADLSLMQIFANRTTASAQLCYGEKYYVRIVNRSYGVIPHDVGVTVSFAPQAVQFGNNTVTQNSAKQAYSFSATVSGYFKFTADGLNTRVYNDNGQAVTAWADGKVFLETGKPYYVVTKGTNGQYTLQVGIDCTTALSGTLSDKGERFVAFTPILTASYEVSGADFYEWYDSDLHYIVRLTADCTYYIRLTGVANATYNITVAPKARLLGANIVHNVTTGLCAIEVRAPLYLRTYCTNGVSSSVTVYTQDLQVVAAGITTDVVPYFLNVARGKYYLQIDVQNDSVVSLELFGDENEVEQRLTAGYSAARTFDAETPQYFTFSCTQTGTYWLRLTNIKSITYNLSVVEAGTANQVIFSSAPIQDIPVYNTDITRASYSMQLVAGKTYTIALSCNQTTESNLSFGIPAKLEQITFDGKVVYTNGATSTQIINVVMAKTYALGYVYNVGASRDRLEWTISNNANPRRIATRLANDKLQIGWDMGLENDTVSITIIDDYYTYTLNLQLKLPVYESVTFDMNNYSVTTELFDYTGAICTDMSVLKSANLFIGGVQVCALTVGTVDIGMLQIFETAKMAAQIEISVNGVTYSRTVESNYTVISVRLANFSASSYASTKRLVIDARNDSISINKVVNPAVVKYLFVIGGSAKAYMYVTFTLPTTLKLFYLQDFIATYSQVTIASNACTVLSKGQVRITGATGDYVFAAKDLTIRIDGKLIIEGAYSTTREQAIGGLYCERLDIAPEAPNKAASLHVTGAEGRDASTYGGNGGHGGIGIDCYTLKINMDGAGCDYTILGGNGGNGYKGAPGGNGTGAGGIGGAGGNGGVGGNGGRQIHARGGSIEGLGQITRFGSCGGNGGDGGVGGNGANGTSSSRDGKDGGNGGNGGAGGKGAVYVFEGDFPYSTDKAADGIMGFGGRGGNGGNGANGADDTSVSGGATAGGNGGNGGEGGDGGIGYNGRTTTMRAQYGDGGNGGDGGVGGNGANGTSSSRDGKDGGNGGDSLVIVYNGSYPSTEAGQGGSGGKKGTGGKWGSDGADGQIKYSFNDGVTFE